MGVLETKARFLGVFGTVMEPLTRPFKMFPEASGAADLGAKLTED